MSFEKNIPKAEMPAEKLVALGPEALSDAELLAIIIRTGTKKHNPIEIARDILKTGNDGLSGLMCFSRNSFLKIEGIGDTKAIQLLALGEISKRIAKQKAYHRLKLSDPESVADYFMEELRYIPEEQVWCAAFDSKFKLIASRMITCGIANSSLVTPREIYRFALEEKAVAIILVHNHPSGDPTPSESDIELTHQMEEAGKIIGISLADHIVIGDNTYFSMKENGYL